MKKALFIATLFTTLSHAALKEEVIEYKDGKTVLEGFVASPENTAKAPGVLIIHNWMGLADYSKMRARQLAEMGYVAFAVDVYGKGVRPQNREEASKLAGEYKGDSKKFRSRLTAALKTLKSMKNVDKSKVAAIGYCFGGTGALELYRSGADINGVISFHGGLSSKMPLSKKAISKAKVLVLHGADDPFVPASEVAAFESEMRSAGADWQLHAYGNAVHAFTEESAGNDNSKGAAYNKNADQRSFEAMKDFFKEIF